MTIFTAIYATFVFISFDYLFLNELFFLLADLGEEDGGGFVVGVLGDEAAFYCFLQNAFL